MFEFIESHFAAPGRTPKGRRALQAIFRAMRETIAERGLTEASLDAIANQAGLSQAALRHYFPTRDDLLFSFFAAASNWFRAEVENVLMQDGLAPRHRLERCIAWHLEYIDTVETVIWLESAADWLRSPHARRFRDAFWHWSLAQYDTLIGQMRPRLSAHERQRRAYVMLTLVLGSWVTHGRGSAFIARHDIAERRQLLIDAAMAIAKS